MDHKTNLGKEGNENQRGGETTDNKEVKKSSMSTLIVWNISKVIEKNPEVDLKVALKAAQERLDHRAPQDVTDIVTQIPEQRHAACALLAWKELGHNDADSLYEFFQNQRKEEQAQCSNSTKSHVVSDASPKCVPPKITCRDAKYDRIADCAQVNDTCKVGPVVKIPTVTNVQMEAKMSRERKIPMHVKPMMDPRCFYENRIPMERLGVPVETTVMRLENDPCNQHQPSRRKALDKDLLRKIDEVCCLESGCVERLAALDASTKELRTRATKLARREAERAELLERAEAAWKDLELGYQRRLALAHEKEEDITRQIQQLMNERNGFKNVCSSLVNQLRDRGDAAEKIRAKLGTIEKQVCERACTRLQLSEEAAREEAALAHQQCLATQLDRDLQFKEEQARRKLANMESELESSMALMNETERAMRAELGGLRHQMGQVSGELLQEDDRTAALKEELDKLEKLKKEMADDLEGCKEVCDNKMQGKVNELAKKREHLEQLKEIKMECRCKMPKDFAVQAKRTPSLAALCRCTPEDKFLESCSCTSLRSSLLSNLLSDLFSGLQSELPETGLAMPCQMLKCLEDNHNWDRATNVKTNLRSFFSRLLVGELEIAIATSIEKYHARWVGASCADMVRRSIPDFGCMGAEGWQQRALERRAQQLAEKLAEQMFKEKAETIMQQAKDFVEAGPPPCACDSVTKKNLDWKKKSTSPQRPPCACQKHPSIFPVIVDVPLRPSNSRPDISRPTKDSKLAYTTPSGGKKVSLSKKTGTIVNKALVSSNRPKSACSANTNRASGTNALETSLSKAMDDNTPECLRRAINDVSLLKAEIEELKKGYIKKNDQVSMEKNRGQSVQHSTETCDVVNAASTLTAPPPSEASYSKESKRQRPTNYNSSPTVIDMNKQVHFKKKQTVDKNMVTKILSKNQPNSVSTDKNKGKSYKRPVQSYAVHLCLCGETKAPKKLLQNAKLIAEGGMNSENEKQAKTRIELKPSNDYESPSLCKSDCVCLNKTPSNTSIDKFLDTLAKWRCDLVDSDKKCKGSTNKNNKIFSSHGNFNNEMGQRDDTVSGLKSKSGYMSKSFKGSNEFISNKSQNVNQGDRGNELLTTTESEYMGAVNLEKSNETFCRCVIAKELENSNVQGLNNMINSGFPIECLNSCDCCTKRLEKISDERSVINKTQIKLNTSSLSKKQSQQPSKNIGDFQKCDVDTKRKNVIHNTDHGESVAKVDEYKEQDPSNHASAIDHIVKNTDFFPCDYHIKFLGVTLANENTRKVEESRYDKNYCGYSKHNTTSLHPEPPINNDIIDQKELWTRTLSDNEGLTRGQEMKNGNLISDKQLTSCQCNVHLNEIKNFFDSAFNRQFGDFVTNENKEVDTTSLNELEINEPCVCCFNINKNKEDTQDLEANTFHLIEEHLREKFEKFKENCKSSCLPHDKEHKFFNSLLQKIKQVILDSTNAVSCKCKEDQEGEGSWNRAYNLLQEYLKVKIKRVQCVCISPPPENENIVPDIADRVCYLIQNDFERLRNFCDCKNRLPQKISNEKHRRQNSTFNRKDSSSMRSSVNCHKRVFKHNNSCSPFMQSLSTQIFIRKEDLENKSCDVMEKLDEEVQTEQKQYVMEDKCSYYSDKNECIGTDNNSLLKSENNDQINTDYPIDNDLPFIGYTVDCSCKHDLMNCVCSKSIVRNDPNKINDIWESHTHCTANDTKMEYIMKNIKKSESLHLCSKHRLCDTQQGNKDFCNTESSANCEDEIVLKESNGMLYRADNNTNTNPDEAFKMRFQQLNNTDQRIWFECNSPADLEDNETNFKSVHFPNEIAVKRIQSEVAMNSVNKSMKRDNCECEMVPVCHVKMLIQNIENKLAHMECVCDSMDPKLCPIHCMSRKSMY